jgi:hypothetical protein
MEARSAAIREQRPRIPLRSMPAAPHSGDSSSSPSYASLQ